MVSDTAKRPDEAAMRRILDRYSDSPEGTILRLAWLEGLSRKELNELTWDQVDFETQNLLLPDRTVPLEPSVTECLRKRHEKYGTVSDRVVIADRGKKPMTLDCGFKTSESPALRGFVGGLRALATAALYLVLKSNGHRHSKNLPVKFGFSPKIVPAYIVKKLPSQRCPQPFLIPIFNFSHKWPTFAFTGESGYTTRLSEKDRTQRLTRRNTGRFGWGRYYYPRSVPHVHKHPRPGCQNGKLCRFWVLVWCAPEERRKPSGQRCAYARRCSEASRPRWAALPCCRCSFSMTCWDSGIERLDQAFRQSYYHTQQPNGQPFGACVEAVSGGKMRAITLDFKESHHGRT